MDSQTAYQMVEACGVMAVMRGNFVPDVALRTTRVLLDEGINVFEFTMNSPQPLEAMQAVKRELGADALVGIGTVLDVDTAKRALAAKADFVVSPAFQPDVVKTVMDANILIAPGVTTTTECVAAWQMGVKLLKLYPVGVLGLEYFNALTGPLDHMKFMCNGGTNAENTRQFIAAGAVACGVGGWLTGDGTWSDDKLRDRARLMRQSIDSVRSGRPMERMI